VFVVRSDDDAVERIKLMDFGLSKRSSALEGSLSLSRDQALIGTPRYMAPEQALGRNREVTSATDQFALGALSYEMLAGKPAFAAETLPELLHAIAFGTPLPLERHRPDLPPAVAQVIARALAKEPAERFPSVQEYHAALAHAAEQAPPVLAGARPRRARVALAIAAGAALVLAVSAWAGSRARVSVGSTPAAAAPERSSLPAPAPAPIAALDDGPPVVAAPATPAPAPDPDPAPKPAPRARTRKLAATPAPASAPAPAPDVKTDAGPPPRQLDLIESL
jgi:serine/threonine-protein kinase